MRELMNILFAFGGYYLYKRRAVQNRQLSRKGGPSWRRQGSLGSFRTKHNVTCHK